MGTNNAAANISTAQVKYKKLRTFSIVSLSLELGGILLSFLFWAFFVNKQFGLIVPLTMLIWMALNTALKIPAFINIVLLIVFAGQKLQPQDSKLRGKAVLFIVFLLISGVVTLLCELLMMLNLEAGSF